MGPHRLWMRAPGLPLDCQPQTRAREGAGTRCTRPQAHDLPALGAELLGVFAFLSMLLGTIYIFTKNIYYICNWEKSRLILK